MADNTSTIRGVAIYLGIFTLVLIILLLLLWPSTPEVPSLVSADSTLVVAGTLKPDSTFELNFITQPEGDTLVTSSDAIAFDTAGVPNNARLDTTLVLVPPRSDITVNDTLLLALILIVGALGACLHALTSLAVFTGNKSFKASWVLWYLLRPATGAILALIFLFVVKGGFSTDINFENLYGIIAIAGLVGLFSKQANDKLAEIAGTLFTKKTDDYKDKLEEKPETAPVIDDFDPKQATVGKPGSITVMGSNFVDASKVQVNGEDRATTFDSAMKLTVTLQDSDVAQAGKLQVTVINPDASDPKDFPVEPPPPTTTTTTPPPPATTTTTSPPDDGP